MGGAGGQNGATTGPGGESGAAVGGRGEEWKVRIELGRRWMSAQDASRLDVGSIVELDCAAGDCVELCAGGRLVARGEAVAVAGKLGVRVRELVSDG